MLDDLEVHHDIHGHVGQWQLGEVRPHDVHPGIAPADVGDGGLVVVHGHDPAGDVIRRFLPRDKPSLILIDELMNYVSRNRKSGLASQLYNFLHNLSEEVRGQKNVVLGTDLPYDMSTPKPMDELREAVGDEVAAVIAEQNPARLFGI